MSELQASVNPAGGARLIGCAGWSLAKEVTAAAALGGQPFQDEGSQLERYASVFPAVEINSSFYRPHQPQTYARWAAGVPEHFRFSVKLPRTITHDARLQDIDPLLDRFAGEAGQLGAKLGCVLVQLPPKGVFVEDVVRDFLPRLRERFACLLAVEARHPTWFGDAATEVLRAHGVVRVEPDPPAGRPGPHVPTTEAAYLRLHGSPRIYYSSYPPLFLHEVEQRILAVTSGGADCWCIFDNTAAFAAVPNALEVLSRVGLPHQQPWSAPLSASTAS